MLANMAPLGNQFSSTKGMGGCVFGSYLFVYVFCVLDNMSHLAFTSWTNCSIDHLSNFLPGPSNLMKTYISCMLADMAAFGNQFLST